jgi:hypothetical protein
MTDLERLRADLDAAYDATYAFDAEAAIAAYLAALATLDAARVAYSAARDACDAYKAARVTYSAARDASKAYLAILAAQEQETPNE